MVFVNSKKYACESCIKGHRSSSCHHTDRPLFEIKKKGRPTSQCERCREARQNRQLHAKCTCEMAKRAGPSVRPIVKKGQRTVPTVPTLPNGLRDAFKDSASSSKEVYDHRHRVNTLLNPCPCPSIMDCKCHSPSISSTSPEFTSTASAHEDGLSALARVAACCAPFDALGPDSGSSTQISPARNRNQDSDSSATSSHSHAKPSSVRKHHHQRVLPARGQSGFSSIRSIALNNRPSPEIASEAPPYPAFNITLPPIRDTTTSHSPPNCGCGHLCVCPDCTLHRGQTSTSGSTDFSAQDEMGDCIPDCRHCIDHVGGVETPNHPSSGPGFLDHFFAQAATLPQPPSFLTAKSRGISLDPMDVRVYPPTLFQSNLGTGSNEEEEHKMSLAFGLVRIPKLECCGGTCGCPDNLCGCGSECGGCCSGGDVHNRAISEERRHHSRSPASIHPSPTIGTDRQNAVLIGPGAGHCC